MKKKGTKRVVILILIAFVVFGGNAFWRKVDEWRFPWAYASSGKPTLSGTWVGSLTTATGLPRGVMIQMDLPRIGATRRRKSRRTRNVRLEGTAQTCDERGQVRSFTVEGRPTKRDASRLTLGLLPSEKPAPDGLTLSNLDGVWDLGSTVHMQAGFYVAKDGGSISGAEYPDTEKKAQLHLTRGGDREFRAVCERVKQTG